MSTEHAAKVVQSLVLLESETPFRRSPHAVVYRVAVIHPAETPGYLKIYPRSSRIAVERVKRVLRGSLALRAFRGSCVLSEAGIPVPEIVAVGELTRSPWGMASFLLEREIPGVALHDYILSLPRRGAQGFTGLLPLKHQFIEKLAGVVSALRSHGVVHGDLQSSNLLVDGPMETLRIACIDTVKSRRPGLGLRRACLEDLKQLNQMVMPCLSLADRLRFLSSYLPKSPLADMPLTRAIDLLIVSSEERLSQKSRSLFEGWDPRGKSPGVDR